MRQNYASALMQDAKEAGPAKLTPQSGILENFQAGVGLTMLTDLEYSGLFWHSHDADRRKKLYDLMESGKVPAEDIDPYFGLDVTKPDSYHWKLLVPHLREKYGIDDIETDEEIAKKNNLQARNLLGYGQSIRDRQGFGGMIAYGLGSIVAYGTSPITALSMLNPVAGAARSTNLLTRVAYRAGVTGLSDGALEMARQPMVMDWRREMGLDYSVKEGVANVAMAVAGSSFMGGAAELAHNIKIFRRFHNWQKKVDGGKEALGELERLERDLNGAISPDQSAVDHLTRIADEEARINGVRPVEVHQPGKAASTKDIYKYRRPPETPAVHQPGKSASKGSARAEPSIPPEHPMANENLDDVTVWDEDMSEFGRSTIVPRTLKDTVDEANETINRLTKAWDCFSNG